MLKIAIYGKGGIGKSTIASNLSAVLAGRGMKVMQIGCDPKSDSTIQLHEGKPVESILDIIRKKGSSAALEELVTVGHRGILCAEAGGPTPGLGCAGRGIITAFEALEERDAFEIYQPDVVIYDVLGDVVCGGFAMPIREGYADKVFIVTSGENMSIYAAANIATAVKCFEERGYASLGGIILNRRNVKREQEKVEELAGDMQTKIIASISRSPLMAEAEELGRTAVEAFPDSDTAKEYEALADAVLAACRSGEVKAVHA
ncbi:MAG: nitrogenase iron protein NifH [Enterocloster sp.]